MPPRRNETKADRARRFLSGGGVARDDSDDELGLEDHPWQWIYDKDDSTIVGARMGAFECFVGDAVLLKAPSSKEAWVGILYAFSEDEEEQEDEDGQTVHEKKASMLWFSPEQEVTNKKKKRDDFLRNELYITANFDDNALATINGKAQICSEQEFSRRFPAGKIPRNSKSYGKVFVCRRGVNLRTTTYTEEFVWEDIYTGADDLDNLVELVESQTVRTRKRKASSRNKDLDEFDEPIEDDDDPTTPRKKRKLTSTTSTPSRSKKLTPRKFTTPSGRKIVTKKALEFTPLGTRLLPSTSEASPHQLARSSLHVSAVPHALPCRETEFETVHTHLETAISAGTGSCIYISGTPGTGKTATVREVVSSLQNAVAEEQLDDFYFVEINGMKVTDPHQSYSLLWEALKGDRVSSTHALELLEREFTTPSPRRVPCVVLMDELDQLVTRNQGVMYNFFNWPQLRHSRLIVLAVANTMDLPERTLSNKISSRLGLTRITFPGYTHTQLMTIIQSRLEGVGKVVVEPDAVQFASRKVAAVSGDARRALDICRRAVELAEMEVGLADQENQAPGTPSKSLIRPQKPSAKGIVTIATIKRAINEATQTPLAAHLRSLPLTSKLFLAALLARLRRTGITESTLADVVDEAHRMSIMTTNKAVANHLLAVDSEAERQDDDLDSTVTMTPSKRGRPAQRKEVERAARVVGLGVAAQELAEAGIIGLEHRHGDRVGRVRLGVAEEHVADAIRDDEECKSLA
ncbi:Putative BAH domain, AAA+ ATPase domain, ATPase, AAA-type, core, AAA lid domain-containing protein [Septoria linicola]|uniref:Origin recognition complex subunit 1 n=1 Tax=Septoria linicola TaxID=215465 RepID=A0A9Q9EEY3_9PEZI|nr:putative BAH domain, AAA+ ATPase domain, ATPase, AAA-type, core, AAA lid domain-containing protein [Septoria linicola]USW47027.1 Putative BAH domain, AAA+ ATPase domain, ATPase, AAA-type, core, AAA lid domain-containing protein [Septoria linicola]